MDKFRDFWVRTALVLALLLPVYFLVAALGTKFHLLDWRFGFGQLTFRWGPLLLLGVAVLALIGLVMAFFTPPRRGMGAALIALLIPAFGIGYALYVRQQAQSIPPIHDISTDLVEPPTFSDAVAQARAAVPSGNDLELLGARDSEGRAIVELLREAYPDIAPIPTGLGQARAFDIALALANEQGWTLGRVDAASGVIEATSASFWYGFVDDIAVRVRQDGSGARIDMRSVSRVGMSDLGANAARMRPFLAELRRRLQEVEGAS